MQALEDVETLIRDLSRSRFLPASDLCAELQKRTGPLDEKQKRKLSKTARDAAVAHVNAGHWMRARVALLTSLFSWPDSLYRAEREWIFCAMNPLRETREPLLAQLARDTAADLAAVHPRLPARLETYRALESFSSRYRRR